MGNQSYNAEIVAASSSQQQKSPAQAKNQGKGARMPKAKAQSLARTMKRLVVVASFLSFGGFTWLANSHATTQTSSSQSSSTTTASSSQSTSTSSSSFFSQLGSGYSFGSSTTSQAPATKSHVSP